MIKGDDAFHEDDDNISLEDLDDDDDISTIPGPDPSLCIVCCHPYLDHGCNLNHVALQICHKRPPYSKGSRSYPTCGLTCASILASGAINAPSHRIGQYGGASRAGSNSSYVQNALQFRVSPAISDIFQYLSSGQGAESLANGTRDRFKGPARPISQAPSFNQTSAAGMQTCVVRISGLCFNILDLTTYTLYLDLSCEALLWCQVCYLWTSLYRKTLQERIQAQYVWCERFQVVLIFEEFIVRQYCHRKPRLSGYNQCGITCRDSAKVACLLCKSRPKFGRYHLCGQTCKQIAMKETPLILEAPPGHSTYNQGR